MIHVLSRVDEELQKYQADHHGEKPLYILVSPYEADVLFAEVRHQEGAGSSANAITSYKGSKIVENDSLKKGDLRLTNELPESGS